MGEIPLAALERILRRTGAKRVSHGALKELSDVLEDFVKDICSQSAVLAEHAGRKTVTASDVKLAMKTLKK